MMSTNWDLLIENHFNKKGNEEEKLSLDLLMESIGEVLAEMPAPDDYLLTERMGTQTLTFSSIPEIPVSEIGWSAMETREGVEVPSEQRSQLAQFLSGIAPGADLPVKIADLSEFYRMDDEMMRSLETGNMKENIGKAMSYLVFFKTLTQILTQFNASSAGFSFESFLGVLLGGKQVPTGEGTIADLTDENGVPISLKLYREGSLEVGGSFTDLSRDLRKSEYKNTMQYIVVTKNLSGGAGEQEGTLNWYRFNFNLSNVYNIIANSSKESRKNILLPKVFIESNGQSVEGVPEKGASMPSAEEMENQFFEILSGIVSDNEELAAIDLEGLKQSMDFAKNDQLFGGKKIRGKDGMKVAPVIQVLRASVFKDSDLNNAEVKQTAIYKAISQASNALLNRYKRDAQTKRRQATLNEMYFYDGLNEKELIERSRVFYNSASPEVKLKALAVAYGFISNGHFNLAQGMVLNVAKLAGDQAGDLFPGDQSQVGIGQLEIGASNVQQVLNKIGALLNQNIFEIFENLKLLTTNIQGYFAGGLQDNTKATTAITAAETIETKTADIADTE